MWLKNTLEEVSTFISRGISPKYIEKGGIRVLNQKCIRNHVINYDLARRHNFELKKFSEDRFIKKGDVLINSTGQGTLGRVAQVREDPKELTTVDSHITIVRPKEELFYLEYFGYSAIAIEKIIKNYGQGASGQTELAKSKVQNELEISFPISLKKQKNIVAKLDAAFFDFNNLISLVNNELDSLENLSKKYLNNSITKKSENDYSRTLKDIAKFLDYRGKTPLKAKKGRRLLTAKNVRMGYLKTFPEEFVSEEEYQNHMVRGLPEVGDVVFTTEAPLGLVAQIEDKNVALGQRLITFQILDDIMKNTYLKFVLMSEKYQKEIQRKGTGATVKGIKAKLLKEIKITYPFSLEEQEKRIKSIEEFEKNISELKSTLSRKLLCYESLKASLLFHELQSNSI